MSESTRDGQDVADTILRWLRWLSVATLVLYVGAILAFGYLWYQNKTQSDASTRALCALRQDLERRVAASEDFLAANPRGIEGISASLLQKSIADQQRTIVALSSVDCPPPPP